MIVRRNFNVKTTHGMTPRLFAAAIFAISLSCVAAASADEKNPYADLKIEKLQTGFDFTEGPAVDAEGNVYFTDIPNSRIHKLDRSGKLSTFVEKSRLANGLMFNAQGELLACQMEGQLVAYSADGKQVRPIAEKYNGKRFNAPNDLVIDSAGGVYFTDPHFRSPTPLPQEKTCVYYLSPDGAITRLIDDLPAPNGAILSPDEKTLYVFPSLQAEMTAYAVESPGKLGAGRVFCTVKQPEGETKTGGDGAAVDVEGNIYVATRIGLQVFDFSGKALGVIELPEAPSNATFGGPEGKTLFVTARTSLYSVKLNVVGHVFGRKK